MNTMIDYEIIIEDWGGSENELRKFNIDFNTEVICHFFDSPFFDERIEIACIWDAVNFLAIKNEVDIVRFNNGNIGFVAYYSGIENGFEIVGKE